MELLGQIISRLIGWTRTTSLARLAAPVSSERDNKPNRSKRSGGYTRFGVGDYKPNISTR